MRDGVDRATILNEAEQRLSIKGNKKTEQFAVTPLTRRSENQRGLNSTHSMMASAAAAKLLSIENISDLPGDVNTAISALDEIYNLVDSRKPVLGFKNKTAKLYVMVCEDKIKTGVLEAPAAITLAAVAEYPRPVNIYNIQQVAKYVKNPDLLRYFPDGMLNEAQQNIKYESIAKTIEYTNDKNDRAYANAVKRGKYMHI